MAWQIRRLSVVCDVRAPHGRSFIFGFGGGLSGPFPFPPFPFLPFPPLPFPPLPFPLPPLLGGPIPPPNAARGSGGALKLLQRVRAEPGRQTISCAY